jgi:hypothetical protein
MRKAVFVFLISMIVILTACELDTFEIEPKGTLKLIFGEFQSRSWEPSISMRVDSYSISGTGPGGRTFSEETDLSAITIPDLYIGTWEICVIAKNNDGIAIGDGVATITIQPNILQSQVIEVVEYGGPGSFSLSITWPIKSADNPMVDVYLQREGASEPTIDELIPIDRTGNFSKKYSNINAGFYRIIIGFLDGANRRKYSTARSVRIVQGQETEGHLTLTDRDLNVVGDLSITITNTIRQSFNVSLSPQNITIGEGSSQLFTATASVAGPLLYSWYLDGELQIQGSENTHSFPQGLELGSHSIDVIASLSGVQASDSAKLQVEEAAYIDLELTKLSGVGPNRLVYRYIAGLEGSLSSVIANSSVIARGDPFALRIATADGEIDVYLIGGFDSAFPTTGGGDSGPNHLLTSYLSTSRLTEVPTELSVEGTSQLDFLSSIIIESDLEDALGNAYGFFCPDEDTAYTYTASIDQDSQPGTFIKGSIEIYPVMLRESSPYSGTQIGTYRVNINFKVAYLVYQRVYKVLYDGNEATYGEGPQYSLAGMGGVGAAINDSEDDPYYFEKSGFQFFSWNTESDGSGTTYYGGSEIAPEPSWDMTLYAQWIPVFPVEELSTGYIFYENPFYRTDGWRYLEAAKEFQNANASWSSSLSTLIGTENGLGTGDTNSQIIVQTSGEIETFARLAQNYESGSAGWYLPSVEEAMHAALALHSYYPRYSEFLTSSESGAETLYSVYMYDDSLSVSDYREKSDYSNRYMNYLPIRKLDAAMNPIPIVL